MHCVPNLAMRPNLHLSPYAAVKYFQSKRFCFYLLSNWETLLLLFVLSLMQLTFVSGLKRFCCSLKACNSNSNAFISVVVKSVSLCLWYEMIARVTMWLCEHLLWNLCFCISMLVLSCDVVRIRGLCNRRSANCAFIPLPVGLISFYDFSQFYCKI